MHGSLAVDEIGVGDTCCDGWQLSVVSDEHEFRVGERDCFCQSGEGACSDGAGLVDEHDAGCRAYAGAYRLLAFEEGAVDGATRDSSLRHDASSGPGRCDSGDGDACVLVAAGDGGECGCLAGSGDCAYQRDGRSVAGHTVNERSLLGAEREAALALDAFDADLSFAGCEDEATWRGGFCELRDALLCGLQSASREPSLVELHDLLERQERAGGDNQPVGVGRRSEREGEFVVETWAGCNPNPAEKLKVVGAEQLLRRLSAGRVKGLAIRTASARRVCSLCADEDGVAAAGFGAVEAYVGGEHAAAWVVGAVFDADA